LASKNKQGAQSGAGAGAPRRRPAMAAMAAMGPMTMPATTRSPARWLEVSIRATAEAAEALSALFEQSGSGGVVVEPELQVGEEVDEVVPAPGAFSVLRTYLPEGGDLERRRRKIEETVGVLRAFDLAPMGELSFRWISEEDWANAWKRHYAVQRIGRHWVVKPRWQTYSPRAGDLVLDLDPGMAFGTGLHPTTQLVLECLEDLAAGGSVAGQTLLDLGTGSGILAIGAARLGARGVLALDVDRVAVSAATDNVAQNGLAEAIVVQRGTLGEDVEGLEPVPGLDVEDAFDGIMANIVARVIGSRAPALARALRPGGWLLASGIIADRESEASRPLEASGLVVEERRQRGDWVTLSCRLPRLPRLPRPPQPPRPPGIEDASAG
jgi:ribosomal protein L11 methyltransferase